VGTIPGHFRYSAGLSDPTFSATEGLVLRHRHANSDEHWDRIQDLLAGKAGDPGVSAQDNRLFVDAVLWIAKSGAP
jgi:hypothetical protein